MLLTTTLIATIPLVIWIYLFFTRGNFWQLQEDNTEPQPLERWPRVVAIVPARNEAETIVRAVASLAKRDYPGEFSVMVVDDHSDDDTAALALKAAEEAAAIGRIAVHSAAELPPGWTGKVWAMNEGVRSSVAQAPDYFWFTDADIEHAPDTLRRLVSRAEKDSLDLASLMVLLQAKTFPERLLIPPFLYFFLMLYPPRWIADAKARTAGAAGGCILLRRDALEKVGGLAAIRNEVIDDCSLARAVKKNGGKLWMGLTRASVSLRGYGSFSEIRDLIARTAFTQLHYSSLLLLGTLIALFVTYVLPLFSFFEGADPAWFLAATAICLMVVSFGVTVRFYNLRFLWALTLPIAAVFFGYATFVSALRYWLGHGAQWKGRSQAHRANGGAHEPRNF
ncbi:MAG TPA: glycosyltransferase [Candidatus Angelobacter sp.]|nr:glycosyltransferase [Candidatus Angelobacter sp.]